MQICIAPHVELDKMAASTPNARRYGSVLNEYFLFILLGFGVVTLWMNSIHEGVTNPIEAFQNQHFSSAGLTSERHPPENDAEKERKSFNEHVGKAKNGEQADSENKERDKPEKRVPVKGEPNKQDNESHKLAGLDCSRHGGPSNDIAAEMVYWSDIPSDNAHMSPFYSPEKFLTFEPDNGGWNNIRMSMETVLAMAVAMGRTLVLPPEQGMYLLGKEEGLKGKQKKHFSFNDFYHLESIANEHFGLNIITMEQFLEREAMTGKLRDASGQISFPPENRTDWNGVPWTPLKTYLKGVSHLPPGWNPDKCMAAFPSSDDPKDLQALTELKTKIETGGWDPKFLAPNAYEEYIGKPNPVNASTEERAKENWAERKTLCIYDKDLQQTPLIHFAGENGGGARLLVHFYAFIFYQDWRHDLWLKRFVRDHVRYVDEIQCAAARIVHAVRDRARKRNPASKGEFDAFHIGRGDFQYKVTRFDADKIYNLTKGELTPNATIYIGTDERDRSFFQPLADHYDLVFLDDFHDLVADVNSNFYGMLDQLITSRGRVFHGCWFSTFTGHINRIRGYHSVKDKAPGHEDGTLPTTFYYALEDRKMHMTEFYPVKKQFYAREFPTAWRGIDTSIGEVTATK